MYCPLLSKQNPHNRQETIWVQCPEGTCALWNRNLKQCGLKQLEVINAYTKEG